MTDRLRIRIAAGITALFLAAISAAGLAAHQDRTSAGAAAPAAQPARTAGSGQPLGAPRSENEAYGDEGFDEEGGEHD